MARRYYSSTAARTTLASGVDNSTTTLSVAAVSGWPSQYPYTLIIDQDTVNEEIVEVSARSGTTLTVTRGVDGTSAVAHDAGAAVNHGVSARDFDEPNAFINGTGVVTETFLADGAVTEAKLATNSVSAVKIVDGTITDSKIGASADIAQSKIANLTSDLASKLPYSYGTATPSTTDSGFLWYDSNSTPAAPKFWDGSAFQNLAPAGGLDLITTESFSAVSSVSVNGCFTSTYANYVIMLVINGSDASNSRLCSIRYRASGSDDSSSNYESQSLTVDGTSVISARSTGQNLMPVTNLRTTRAAKVINVWSPQLAERTQSHSQGPDFTTALFANPIIGTFTSATQFDGFSLIVAAGTITGTLRVYGYKD